MQSEKVMQLQSVLRKAWDIAYELEREAAEDPQLKEKFDNIGYKINSLIVALFPENFESKGVQDVVQEDPE